MLLTWDLVTRQSTHSTPVRDPRALTGSVFAADIID